MANEYVTSAELKGTLELSSETFADPDIQRAVVAASRGVDNVVMRRFWKDPDANQVRYYSPDWSHLLVIDDLVDLTELATDPSGDGTWPEVWAATDYLLEPLNAAAEADPFDTIRANGRFQFPCVPKAVRVTGRFGWPAVPDPVKEATSIVATKLLRRAREAPFGVVGFGMDGAAVRLAKTDPDVAMLLDHYLPVAF